MSEPEQNQSDPQIEQKSEHLNGGVEVRSTPQDDIKQVTHLCVGCGKVIRSYKARESYADDTLGSQPIHDSPQCENLADEMEADA